MYAGSVAELNCRLQSQQQELEQMKTTNNCLQAKYDAARVCTVPAVLDLNGFTGLYFSAV